MNRYEIIVENRQSKERVLSWTEAWSPDQACFLIRRDMVGADATEADYQAFDDHYRIRKVRQVA